MRSIVENVISCIHLQRILHLGILGKLESNVGERIPLKLKNILKTTEYTNIVSVKNCIDGDVQEYIFYH